jgi:hypothetical protein
VSDARPGLLHLAGDDQKVGRVPRQAVNGRDDDHVASGELLYQPRYARFSRKEWLFRS